MSRSVRIAALVILLGAILTACTAVPAADPDLTLDQARHDVRVVAEEVQEFIPADAITTKYDDWTSKDRTLLPCNPENTAFQYSNSITSILGAKVDYRAILDAVAADFSSRDGWVVRWDQHHNPPISISIVKDKSAMYIGLSFVHDEAVLVAFSDCFAGDEYNLLDKY